HHALDAEVQDAGTLGQQLPDPGEHQRGPVQDRRDDDRHPDVVVDAGDHRDSPAATEVGSTCVDMGPSVGADVRDGCLRNRIRYRVAISAPSTQNSRIPSIVPVSPIGKPGPWSANPALMSAPMTNDTSTTPNGLYRASAATTMPV